ncbi:MAG: hypothetical protein FWD17_03660, partial [Polyangiaceae bacterium]|nr:hypothetical protein [Polyangiaceae bacterium]
ALGFVGSGGGSGTLYFVALDLSHNPPSPELGVIDTSTYTARRVAPFGAATSGQPILAGTPDGGLFVWLRGGLDQVDTSTGAVTSLGPLVNVGSADGLAFWGGSLYIFHVLPTFLTSVERFTPGESSVANVAMTNRLIVAAAASPCP